MSQKRRPSLDTGAANKRRNPSSSLVAAPHACVTCSSRFQNLNALKKHRLKHEHHFVCKEPGCTRTEGFGSRNDVDRHRKTIHGVYIPELKDYKCQGRNCNHPDKVWTRPDNFKTHVRTIHKDEDLEDIVQRSEMPAANAPDQSTTYQPATPSTGTRRQSASTHHESGEAPDYQQYPQHSTPGYAPAFTGDHQHGNIYDQALPQSIPDFADAMAQAQGNPTLSQSMHFQPPQLGSPFSPPNRLDASLHPMTGQNVHVPHILVSPPGAHATVVPGGNASWDYRQDHPGTPISSPLLKDKHRADDYQRTSSVPNSVFQMRAALVQLGSYNQPSHHTDITQIGTDQIPRWSNAVTALHNAMLTEPVSLSNHSIDHLAQAAIMVADGQFSQGSMHSHLANPDLTPSHVRLNRATALVEELKEYDRIHAERQWRDVQNKVILQLASNHQQSEELVALSTTASNDQSLTTIIADHNQYTENDQFSGGNDNASSSGVFGSIPKWSPRQDASPFMMPYGAATNMDPIPGSPSSPTPSGYWRNKDMPEPVQMSSAYTPLPVAVPASAHTTINTLKQHISAEQSPRDSAYSSFTCHTFLEYAGSGYCFYCQRTLDQHDPESDWFSHDGMPSPP